MTVRPFRLSRRAALRGVAAGITATIALPRLEAMLGHHGDAYADGTADGAGNLLDRACVLGTSCTAYGPSHDTKDYPLVIAGRAAGGLVHPGIHFRQTAEDNASRVPLTLLKLMGVPMDSWGVGVLHADKPITELLV